MARLYSNENFPLPVVEHLRKLGHDLLTVQETGRADQSWPDEEVLAFAVRNDRIVLTLNRKHFFRLHRQNQLHVGIIACTYDPDFVRLAQRIDQAIRGCPNPKGQLIRVNRPHPESP